MAYTNAIFYMDYELGNDAVRTTLTDVVFSNPGSTTVLGTKVGHGLVTGACITVSGCTQAYANTVWKITRVDNDTFTVDTALWASWTGADVTGDVVPFGGQSWADAWKTIKNGATAARIRPGDIIRIAKSPAPTSIGNATWANLSKTVTLETSQTSTIDNCEAAWTANGSGDATVTLTGVVDAKEGSYCMKIALDASPQTNTMQAYYDIYTHNTTVHDLSSYQKISFWIYNQSNIIANNWTITLCSDTAGAVPVDIFNIPNIIANSYHPITIARNGGGNLGNAIKSIAINTGSDITGMASKYVYIDNFIACTASGINLQSLISKNDLEQGGVEGWHGIQSIVGTTILLDNGPNTSANSGRGYYGISETITTYKRETFKMSSSDNFISSISGTSVNRIQFLGGYDTGTTLQTGETIMDGFGNTTWGFGISYSNYITMNRVSACRCFYGIAISNSSNPIIEFANFLNNNAQSGINIDQGCSDAIINSSCSINNNGSNGITLYRSGTKQFLNIGKINNNGSNGISCFESGYIYSDSIASISNNGNAGIVLYPEYNNNTFLYIGDINNNGSMGISIPGSSGNIFSLIDNINGNMTAGIVIQSSAGVQSFRNSILKVGNVNNNVGYGVKFLDCIDNTILSINTEGNTSGAFYSYNYSVNYIYNANVQESTIYTSGGCGMYPCLPILYINKLNGYSRYYTGFGYTISQDATAGGTGIEWKTFITNTASSELIPHTINIAKIAVVADVEVTVTCYFKKSHATDIAGKLVCRGSQIAGVDNDVTDTCSEDTNRNQLSIQFTPTESGVVEIEVLVYWVANTADENIIIDDISVSQE